MPPDELTHLDPDGRPLMVDVGEKAVTPRRAVAEGRIRMRESTLRAVQESRTPKGDVLQVSQIAGIMAAKRTAELIPLCHPLPLESVEVEIVADPRIPGFRVRATARVRARTGVEMEALTAVTVSLLTLYDMCKGLDREMRIEEVKLLHKEGGRSGSWSAAG
jgi:cyclic pyranopterin monophosphate synthase